MHRAKTIPTLIVGLLTALTTTVKSHAMIIDFEPLVGTITGSDTLVFPFDVSTDTDLTWILTDLETPAPFTNLGLAITTEDVSILGIINEPGELDVSLVAGSYLAIVGGVTDSDINIGTFGLTTMDLPVPGAVYLFGSALAGFVGLARRRKPALAPAL